MIPTPFQPIRFGDAPEICCGGRTWQHEIFADDEVVVQVQVGACPEADEEITNTDINNSDDWDKFRGDGSPDPIFNNRLADNSTLVQTLSLTEGDWYEIRLNLVYPWTDAALFETQTIRQNIISIEGFQEPIEVVAATGEYVIYGRWGAGTDLTIRRTDTSFEAPGPSELFNPTQVLSISIKEVTAPTIEAVDLDGTVLDTVAITELNYPFVNINYLPNAPVLGAGAFQLRITQGCSEPEVLTTEPIIIVEKDICLIRVVGCGNNTFFKGGFAPPLRIRARFVDDGPVGEREIARNSVGVHRLTYGHVHFSYLLDVEEVPEHIRHFLYLLPYFETIAIQIGENRANTYFALEDVEKNDFPGGDDSLSGVSLRVVRKELNLTARYFGRCFPSFPPFVLGERSTNTAITDETETILINAN